MSKIVQLDSSYQLWLSHSWSSNNHGICGHTFEIFDYYYILKKFFKVGILFGVGTDWNFIEKAIRFKYNFTENEILEIKNNTRFEDRPRLLKGTNILFVDGGVINTAKVAMYFDNIFYFACGNKEIKDNNKKNVWILQDYRVYDPVRTNGVDYKKRILFDKLKSIGPSKDRALVYATKNCRQLDSYQELLQYSNNILAITNKENKPNPIEGFKFVIPPVDNLFEEFNTYIYTPIKRKWDCSPRFIAECKYYNKKVIYHNIDYWNIDKGLSVRKWDIDNDFNSLYLTDADPIINIIKEII